MLLSILYSYLIKASSGSSSQEFESMFLSDEQDNSLDEIIIDSSYIPQGGSEISFFYESHEIPSSEDEVIDYLNNSLSTQQNMLQVDGIFVCCSLVDFLKEDESVSDIENPSTPEYEESMPTTSFIIN